MALINITSEGVQLLVHTILNGTVQETFDTKFNLYFNDEDFDITQDGDKSIVSYGGTSGGLLYITEEGVSGYRLANESADNHGDIGEKSVDLSIAESPGPYGATGYYSFSVGYESTASGDYAISIGNSAFAQGESSVALGGGAQAIGVGSMSLLESDANGHTSLSLGKGIIVDSFQEAGIGSYNTVEAGNATSYVETDRAFSVGIGENGTARKNGLSIFKNGKVYADSLLIEDILDDKQLVTKEYVTGSDTAGFTLSAPDLTIDLNRISGINYLDTTNTDNVTNIITAGRPTEVNGFAVIRFNTTTWTGTGEPTVDSITNQKVGEVSFADYDVVDMVIFCKDSSNTVEYFYIPV